MLDNLKRSWSLEQEPSQRTSKGTSSYQRPNVIRSERFDLLAKSAEEFPNFFFTLVPNITDKTYLKPWFVFRIHFNSFEHKTVDRSVDPDLYDIYYNSKVKIFPPCLTSIYEWFPEESRPAHLHKDCPLCATKIPFTLFLFYGTGVEVVQVGDKNVPQVSGRKLIRLNEEELATIYGTGALSDFHQPGKESEFYPVLIGRKIHPDMIPLSIRGTYDLGIMRLTPEKNLYKPVISKAFEGLTDWEFTESAVNFRILPFIREAGLYTRLENFYKRVGESLLPKAPSTSRSSYSGLKW